MQTLQSGEPDARPGADWKLLLPPTHVFGNPQASLWENANVARAAAGVSGQEAASSSALVSKVRKCSFFTNNFCDRRLGVCFHGGDVASYF